MNIDMDRPTITKDPLEVSIGPITTSSQEVNETQNGFVQHIEAKSDFKETTTHMIWYKL
jgi:hypothetical protein